MRKTLLLTTIAAALAGSASAQIKYHDINPDTTISTWDMVTIAPIVKLPGYGTSNAIDIWWHPVPEVVVNGWNDCEVLYDAAGTYPAMLKAGDSISASGTWKKPNYDPLNKAGVGNWTTNATDKYLGIRAKNNGVWNYAWLKMTVANAAASFTVKEYAAETSGKKINAGVNTSTTITYTTQEYKLNIVTTAGAIDIAGLEGTNNITLTDIGGRVVYNTVATAGKHSISTQQLTKAVYILRIGNGEKHIATKVQL